ncbi:g6807 [Coccomyxa elongata]
MEGAAQTHHRHTAAASPARSRPAERLPSIVAGKEVVGRKLAVWKNRVGEWVNGKLVDFDAPAGQHKVRYEERGAREEEWLSLSKCRFAWQGDLPPGSQHNPTFVPGLTPSGHDAVDQKVKVFWPGMGKWYAGKVAAYDGRSAKHTILYKDGDVQRLTLRQEAVVWPDVPGLDGPGLAARLAGEADAAEGVRGVSPKRHSMERGNQGRKGGAAEAEQGSSSTGARKGGDALKREAPEQQGPVSKRTRRMRPDGAAAVASKPADSNCSDALSQDFSQQNGTNHHSKRSTRAGAVPHESHPSGSPSGAFISTEPAVTHFTANGEHRSGDVIQASGSAADHMDKGVNGGRATPATSSSAAEVEVDIVGQPAHAQSTFHGGDMAQRMPLHGSGAPAGQLPSPSGSAVQPQAAAEFQALQTAQGEGMQQQRGGGRGRGRGGRGRGRGRGRGGRGRGGGGSTRDGQPDLTHALEAVVGCRVGVWWADDEAFYKGEVTAFDSYHKRNKIMYDDGEEEWVALQRETFSWLTPRASAAGATPELASAMRLLGATNAGAAPPLPELAIPSFEAFPVESPVQAPGAPPPLPPIPPDLLQAAAAMAPMPAAAVPAVAPASANGASAAGPQGIAAVGWRVTVPFEGDGTMHRGEVLAYKEENGQHQVFYEDGEDEWVDLAAQKIATWQEPVRGVVSAPGLPEGTPLPKGRAAIGWRIGVYWRDDAVFYAAEIIGFDTGTGRHQVLYDDGEEEMVSLTTEKVKWMLPPGVRGSADSSDESEVDSDFDSSEEEEEERPRRRSSRRRGRGRAGPGSRRVGRRPQRSPSYEPSERRMRLDGPHCHQPTRFGPGYTPPTSPTFARKATAHGSLCLYPEDTPDGVIPQSFAAPTPPIVVPARDAARDPVLARDVSADRGVRLPNGARLRVTRVNIFLSEEEDHGNAATDEPAAAIAAAEDAPLVGPIESSAVAAVVVGGGAKPAAGGRACKLRDVLARVATAEACIAQHASQDAPGVPDANEDGLAGQQLGAGRQAHAQTSSLGNPPTTEGDPLKTGNAAASSVPPTPMSALQLPGKETATPAATALVASVTPGTGGYEMWAASAAPPAVNCASALWSSLVHPPSPFGLPVSQNVPVHAPPRLPADAPPAATAAPADVADASGDRTVPDVRCSMIASEVEQLPESGQLTLPDGHKPQPLHTAARAANGAAAAVTKSGSFGIPETPSLGGELRGGFTLPQRLNSIQLQGKCASGSGASCEPASGDPPRTCHTEMEPLREGVTVAQ